MNIVTKRTRTPAIQPFERLFDRFFDPWEMAEPRMTETAWVPAVDLTDAGTEFVLKVDAPGFHKENLDINLDGEVVTVSGRREVKKDEETKEFVWRERAEGTFMRSLRMPTAIDPTKVTALYEDGVLVVRIPKAQPPVRNKVTIK